VLNSTIKGEKKSELEETAQKNIVFIVKENQQIIGYVVTPFRRDTDLISSIEYLNTDYKLSLVGNRKLSWLNETANTYNLLNSYTLNSKSLDEVCSEQSVELRRPVLVITQDQRFTRSNRRPITLTTSPYINGTKSDLFRIKPQFSYLDQFIMLLKEKAVAIKQVFKIGLLCIAIQLALVIYGVRSEYILVAGVVTLFVLYFGCKKVVFDLLK
jgi:hypothetical protein